MRGKHLTFAISALAIAGLGLVSGAQQKPVTASRASSINTVVVYKSPT